LLKPAQHAGNDRGIAYPPLLEGISKMIALKVIALALVAGTLFSIYSGELGADFVLAIVSCLT